MANRDHRQTPCAAGGEVDVGLTKFPGLVHQRDHRRGRQMSDQFAVERPEVAAVGDDLALGRGGVGGAGHDLEAVGDPAGLRQRKGLSGMMIAAAVAVVARHGVDAGGSGQPGHHCRRGIGAARGLGQHGEAGEVEPDASDRLAAQRKQPLVREPRPRAGFERDRPGRVSHRPPPVRPRAPPAGSARSGPGCHPIRPAVVPKARRLPLSSQVPVSAPRPVQAAADRSGSARTPPMERPCFKTAKGTARLPF